MSRGCYARKVSPIHVRRPRGNVRDPFRSTGWVVALDEKGRPQYAGTCFSFRRPNYFLTAAHCVDGLDRDRISVSIFTDHLEQGLEVVRLERHPQADVAFLEIQDDGPDLDVFSPFQDTTDQFEWGESVTAFGYPEFTNREVQHNPAFLSRPHSTPIRARTRASPLFCSRAQFRSTRGAQWRTCSS